MYALYNVKIYMSSIFCYIMLILSNVEVIWGEIACVGNSPRKGENKVLVIHSVGVELSKF